MGLGKAESGVIAAELLEPAGLQGLAMPQAGLAGEGWVARRLTADPVHPAGGQAAAEQQGVVVALNDNQGIAGRILGGHEPRRFKTTRQATDAEPLALAEGEIGQPRVFAEAQPLRCLDGTRVGGDIAGEEVAEAAFANETDAGAVLFGRRRQAGSSCQGCLLYTSPSPRDRTRSRMPSSA